MDGGNAGGLREQSLPAAPFVPPCTAHVGGVVDARLRGVRAKGLAPGNGLRRVEDMAGAIALLASEEAGFVDNASPDLNGGQSMAI